MKKIINHIKKIRTQPEHIRRYISHVAVGICAVILILLWIYSLSSTFTNPDTQTKMVEDLKPFAVLKDNMVSGYNNITKPDLNTMQ